MSAHACQTRPRLLQLVESVIFAAARPLAVFASLCLRSPQDPAVCATRAGASTLQILIGGMMSSHTTRREVSATGAAKTASSHLHMHRRKAFVASTTLPASALAAGEQTRMAQVRLTHGRRVTPRNTASASSCTSADRATGAASPPRAAKPGVRGAASRVRSARRACCLRRVRLSVDVGVHDARARAARGARSKPGLVFKARTRTARSVH